MDSLSYADRVFLAAVKRRGLETLALRALMRATELLGLVLGRRLAELREAGDPLGVALADVQVQTLHARAYEEAARLLASRWDKLPERRRPHYSPESRYRILRLKRPSPPTRRRGSSASPRERSCGGGPRPRRPAGDRRSAR